MILWREATIHNILNVGPSSQDNSRGKTPHFHTSKLGESLGRKVEQH